jgi:hypothetical protein
MDLNPSNDIQFNNESIYKQPTLEDKFGPPPVRPPRQKVFLTFLSILTLIGVTLIMIITVIKMQNQSTTYKSKAGSDQNLMMSLVAGKTTVKPGETFDVSIVGALAANGYTISAITTGVNYDSSTLNYLSITPGDFFSRATPSGVLSTGLNWKNETSENIEFAIGAMCTNVEPLACYPVKLSGTVMTMHFKAKTSITQSVDSLITINSASTSATKTDNCDPNTTAGMTECTTNVATIAQGNLTIHIVPDAVTTPTLTLTPTSTIIPNLTPTSTVITTPTITLTPSATPTSEPDTVNLTVKVKFDGVTSAKSGAKIYVMFKQGASIVLQPQAVAVTGNTSGIYTGTLNNVTPGTYDIYIKGWAHLSRKTANFTVSTTNTILDISDAAHTLIGGDTVCINPCSNTSWSDNKINILDLGKVLKDYDPIPAVPTTSLADLNLDGKVNILDLGMVLKNYNLEGE